MRIAMTVLAMGCLIGSAAQALAAEPKTEEEKILYATGLALSRSLGSFNLTKAELEMVQTGIADGVTGSKPQVDLQVYGPKINELQQGRVDKTSKAYLAKAAEEKGAVKTASGLIYVPIKAGSGATPKAIDTVKVHYHGTLPSGAVFDSSVQRKEPATFPLNQVIKCWTEGVQKMKVGGKAKLVCPPDIAYGDRGAGSSIPPKAVLVFEVELLEIVKTP